MTTETVVDLTPALIATQRYAAKLLTNAEDSDPNDFEFSVAHHFTWNTGIKSVSMTTLVTAQQPTPGRFNLRIDFTGNGSEAFRLTYAERIVDWVVDLLETNGWEVPVTTNPTQKAKARVSHEEGFVFYMKRPSSQR